MSVCKPQWALCHILAVMAVCSLAAAAAAPATGQPNDVSAQAVAPPRVASTAEWDTALDAASTAWVAGDLAMARTHLERVVTKSTAPPHYRSYARLRIAQSYLVEGAPAAARKELAAIAANTAYPAVHREEARQQVGQIDRTGQGLPPRDPAASQTAVEPIGEFAVEYFVSPAGNDANPGTRAKPFVSLARARDAVRRLKQQGPLAGPVGVRLLPGKYMVTETFELSAEDSGSREATIVYRGDGPGPAVLYGGVRLEGFTKVTDPGFLARLPNQARDKVFQCDLRNLGIGDYDPLVERGYGTRPPDTALELFFNGKPMHLARWPNSGFVDGVRVVAPGSKSEGKPSVFEYADDRHSRWNGAGDGWLFGYFRHGWADRQIPILKVDAKRKLLHCGPYEQSGYGMEPIAWFNEGRIKYYAFNLIEELDSPGEWYLDRNRGMLYLYPPSDIRHASVELGRLGREMLALRSASYIRIERLTFDLGRARCMSIEDSTHCLIAGCTVRRFAGNGIVIRGGRENGIFGCDIYSLGRRATEVSGGDRQTLTPGGHFVENCFIHSFGRLDHTYVPAVQLEGCGNRVAHCLLGDCPSSVIRIEGNDHRLEYNRVYRAVLESEDQGAMELFGNPTYRGVVFRHNYFSDIGPPDVTEIRAGRAAIRLDDAISGLLIYGNVFERASQGFGAIQINGGRDNIIDNNIFAHCETGISGKYRSTNKHWAMLGKDPAFIMSALYLNRYPELKLLGQQPALNNAWRNIFLDCGAIFSSHGEPSESAFRRLANTEYKDADPGFVDAARGNFRLRPDADLFRRVTFAPIPLDEIGLFPSRYRASGVDQAMAAAEIAASPQ